MADLTEVYAALQKADAAGDTAGAKQLADYIRAQTPAHRPQSLDSLGDGTTAPTGSPQAHAAQSPTQGGFADFAAGYGRAGHNLYQGLKQSAGFASNQDVQNSRDLDAPLLNSTGGKWGNGIGTVADLAPTMMVPGANTAMGAAGIGAVTGLMQPSTSDSETLANTGFGGLGGAGGIWAGRALGVGYNAAKATIQPFFNSGQDAIAARTLQQFAGGPQATQDAVANITRNGQNVLPGLQPTTAELANNAGLSQLERQLSINPDTLNQMTTRTQANSGVMKGALSNIAGTPAQMEAAVAARSAVSKPLYDAAGKAQVTADPALNALMQRPSMQSAVSRAGTLAAERGEAFMPSGQRPLGKLGAANGAGNDPLTLTSQPQFSGLGSLGNTGVSSELGSITSRGALSGVTLDPLTLTPAKAIFDGKNIQYLKMALNDMANSGPQMGMGSHEVGAVKGTLGSLNEWTQANVPELRAADAAYANASKPINQMEIGQQLSNKLNPALNDFGTTPRLNANSYAQAVRNGDSIAADVTGNKAATLESTLSPSQLQTVNQIGEQLARRANATDLGRATGSNTAQNLVSQNMLRQTLGPMGLPESWGESVAKNTLMQSIMRPMQFIGKAGEGRVLDKLSNAALNPTEAARLMQLNIDPSVAKAIWARQGLFGSIGTSGQLVNSSQQ